MKRCKSFEAAPALPAPASPGSRMEVSGAASSFPSDSRIKKHYDEVLQRMIFDEVKTAMYDMDWWNYRTELPPLTPIEKIMWAEIGYIWHNWWSYNLKFIPQKQIGNYRVDFLVKGLAPITQDIVVECDGHDFHERTKEQARRDRAMDRWLQQQGLKILRFTGSEIWACPEKCGREIVDLLWEWHNKKFKNDEVPHA